jgi:hypothetical protein
MERQRRNAPRKMIDGGVTLSVLIVLALVEIFKATINFIWYYFLRHLWESWWNKKGVDPPSEKK